MKILHRELTNNGIFYIEENGRNLAVMSYSRNAEDHITINHTEVDDVLKGKGAGKQLLASAVAWARNNNTRITARCSFALALFEKITDFSDVWQK